MPRGVVASNIRPRAATTRPAVTPFVRPARRAATLGLLAGMPNARPSRSRCVATSASRRSATMPRGVVASNIQPRAATTLPAVTPFVRLARRAATLGLLGGMPNARPWRNRNAEIFAPGRVASPTVARKQPRTIARRRMLFKASAPSASPSKLAASATEPATTSHPYVAWTKAAHPWAPRHPVLPTAATTKTARPI